MVGVIEPPEALFDDEYKDGMREVADEPSTLSCTSVLGRACDSGLMG